MSEFEFNDDDGQGQHVCDDGCRDGANSYSLKAYDVLGITCQAAVHLIGGLGNAAMSWLNLMSREFYAAAAHRRLQQHHDQVRLDMANYLAGIEPTATLKEPGDE